MPHGRMTIVLMKYNPLKVILPPKNTSPECGRRFDIYLILNVTERAHTLKSHQKAKDKSGRHETLCNKEVATSIAVE